ncbi:hypothetical protein AAC387_Pa07g3561 [Persea americana]
MMKMGRAEIDTRAPFRSVKEAVALFGEKVLAGEVYANKLKEMQVAASGSSYGPSRLNTVTAELEETKESLKKAKEEGLLMANCLTSLKEELELTKRELHQLKAGETDKQPNEPIDSEIEELKFVKQPIDSEMEDLKFMENATEIEVHPPPIRLETEFQRKRYVKFADSPSLARVMATESEAVLERHPSLKKKKKKPLIPLIGGIFSKKKGHGHQEAGGF